jgi:hypothetical protein
MQPIFGNPIYLLLYMQVNMRFLSNKLSALGEESSYIVSRVVLAQHDERRELLAQELQ